MEVKNEGLVNPIELDHADMTAMILAKDPLFVIGYYTDLISGLTEVKIPFEESEKAINGLYQVINIQSPGGGIDNVLLITEHRYAAIFKVLPEYSPKIAELLTKADLEEKIYFQTNKARRLFNPL